MNNIVGESDSQIVISLINDQMNAPKMIKNPVIEIKNLGRNFNNVIFNVLY